MRNPKGQGTAGLHTRQALELRKSGGDYANHETWPKFAAELEAVLADSDP